jgi:hypothetical protein
MIQHKAERPSERGERYNPHGGGDHKNRKGITPGLQIVFCPICFVGVLGGDFRCPRCGRRFQMVEMVH